MSTTMSQSDLQTCRNWLDAYGEAEATEQRLQQWEKDLPGRWRRRATFHQLSSSMRNSVDVYDDLQVAKVWNQYRCARIILHEVTLQILERSEFDNRIPGQTLTTKIISSTQIITAMLSGICDSISFHQGNTDGQDTSWTRVSQKVLSGEHLLWPLSVVLRCPWSNGLQRDQARRTLELIGRELGISRASKIIASQLPHD